MSANQTIILSVLEGAAPKALSAYEILDKVRPLGIRAPTVVYRALEKLVAGNVVYRLESRSAYVAATIIGGGAFFRPAFAICRSCGDIEVLPEVLVRDLTARLETAGFSIDASTVELQGRCQTCANPESE